MRALIRRLLPPSLRAALRPLVSPVVNGAHRMIWRANNAARNRVSALGLWLMVRRRNFVALRNLHVAQNQISPARVIYALARPSVLARATSRLAGKTMRVLARAVVYAPRKIARAPSTLAAVAARAGKRVQRRAIAMAFAMVEGVAALALAVAVPLGRLLTGARGRFGTFRTMWGVTPILTLPVLARSSRLLGLRSESLVYKPYHITRAFDHDLSWLHDRILARFPPIHDAVTRIVLAGALLRYDFFHYFYDRGIVVPPNGRIWLAPQELKALSRAGKRIYAFAYGADVRTRETTLKLGRYNFCTDCTDPMRYCICSEEEAARNVAGIRAYANATVSMLDMIHYVPGCRNMHYWPIDTDAIRYIGCDWRGERPLRLLHAPNHMHFKGSRFLFAAVERLQDEGVAIELQTISGKSNAEVLAAMAECDVVAEQFLGGAYGYTAVEGWALGKPVLTYVRDALTPASWEDLPAILADPDRLYDVLRALCTGAYDLPRIGLASRRFAERYYSLDAVALGLGRMYLETGSLPAPTRRRIERHMERVARRLERRCAGPVARAAA